jgi:hypothetical protein
LQILPKEALAAFSQFDFARGQGIAHVIVGGDQAPGARESRANVSGFE